MITLRSHYRLADLVLSESTKELEDHVHRGRVDMPEWIEVQKHHLKSLERAESNLPFHRLAMSVQMESALPTEHERQPFVHVFTSLPDQGVGTLDIQHARKDILQEIIFSDPIDRGTRTESLKDMERKIDKQIDEIEKSGSIEDGTIQVHMGEFFKDEDYGATVSEAKEFSLFLPSLGKEGTDFEDRYFPSDTTIHFQVHSKIENSEGNASHQLTGTGFLHLSKLVKEVMKHASRGGEEDYMVSVQIPLKLNSVSSQDPEAKTVYRVSRARDLQSENEQLYQGSLFLYVDLRDKDTQDFFHQFTRGTGFSKPSRDDVTSGNFPHIATSMRMHIVRDMAPFIPEFTESIPISLEEKVPYGGKGIGERANTRVVSGWIFESSLPEGKGIHAPYNKGNTHTLPGFTYFSDRAMQRLPNTEFILHVSKTVLDRWNMSEKDFIKYANNPVMKNKVSGKMKLAPQFIDVLAITAETLTAYPTSMNYRGDYADMNTTVVRKLRSMDRFDHETIHHLEHGTGMTRIPSVSSSSSSRWNPSKKIGTEMFGDAVIDKSGDCEDFAKLIDRMVVGIQTSKSTHPLVKSLQMVLSNYEPYSVLSSVTSRNIREAPSTSNAPRRTKEEKRFEVAHSGVCVGSAEDLKAGIGAHMWTILLPSSMIEKAVRATHQRKDISDEHKTFLQDNLPPLILEGTGPALSLLLAKESYHSEMPDKVTAINTELARLEALARMMTGFTSDQITYESMRSASTIFSPFTIPIQTNRIIDLDKNERPSPFYRMAVEMFAVGKDERVVPSTLIQLEERKDESKPFPLHASTSKEKRYWRARTIPVQLGPRNGGEEDMEGPVIGYKYGINLTDLVHRREDIFGMLETIRSSNDEQRIINNVMRHSPPSPVIRLAPKEELEKAKSMAIRVEKILNFEDSEDSLQRTLSRGYMGRPQDLYEVHMYIRTDNLNDEHVRKLANHFADNGFVGQEPIRVNAESFTKGHHLLRISVPVDVTGTKQLYFESDALAERLETPADRRGGKDVTETQKTVLLKELKKLMS